MSLKYPVSVKVWMDHQTVIEANVDSPEQSDHWMQAFMADDWLELNWYWNGELTQVVRRNMADRYDPLILEVA